MNCRDCKGILTTHESQTSALCFGCRAISSPIGANEHLQVLSQMQQYGGSFVKALASAWERADEANSATLHRAFKDLYSEYRRRAIKGE